MDNLYSGVAEGKSKGEISFICVAVHDCTETAKRQGNGYGTNMMTFKQGDEFLILDSSDKFGLWYARSLSTNNKGWIPSSYVMPETEK